MQFLILSRERKRACRRIAAVFDQFWGILSRFTPFFCRLNRPNPLIPHKNGAFSPKKRPQTSANVPKCPHFRGYHIDSQRFPFRAARASPQLGRARRALACSSYSPCQRAIHPCAKGAIEQKQNILNISLSLPLVKGRKSQGGGQHDHRPLTGS